MPNPALYSNMKRLLVGPRAGLRAGGDAMGEGFANSPKSQKDNTGAENDAIKDVSIRSRNRSSLLSPTVVISNLLCKAKFWVRAWVVALRRASRMNFVSSSRVALGKGKITTVLRKRLLSSWRGSLASVALCASLAFQGVGGVGAGGSESFVSNFAQPPSENVVRHISPSLPHISSSWSSAATADRVPTTTTVETASLKQLATRKGSRHLRVKFPADSGGGGGGKGRFSSKFSSSSSSSSSSSGSKRRTLAAVLPKSKTALSPRSSSGKQGDRAGNKGGKAVAQVVDQAKARVGHIYSEIAEDASEAIAELQQDVQGSRRDVLILLLATAVVVPVFKQLNLSPVLGFLLTGCALGPLGFSFVSDVKTIETLAEFGIVFFLFEMGLELSLERLVSMRRDVFGLGFAQMATSAVGLGGLLAPALMPGCSSAARIVVGFALALSSSAFALQILKDKDDMNTRHGRAAFGILLFQDLAVVPILVCIPLLAGGGSSLAVALRQSLIKSVIALSSIAFIGRFVLDKIFSLAARSKSQEAFLSLILLTVTGMSILTEGLGLSNTLGAFLAGVLLSETKYKYQVEADIVPFRGLLLGLFFVTVGFSIDCTLLLAEWPKVLGTVFGLLLYKAGTITLLCRYVFKMSTSQGLQAGLLLAQGGEFAFVVFRLALNLSVLSPYEGKLLMTSTAITMALTPTLADAGRLLGERLERRSGFSHYVGNDLEADEIKQDKGLVVVMGFGRIGKVVCEVLDQKFIRYIAFEVDPAKAIEARNRGLPVFFGDVSRPEVLQNFNVGSSKMVVVAMGGRAATNRAVINIKRMYPDLPVLARAVDAEHRSRLQNTLKVMAMVPVLPEDSLLLNLPFGGSVLKALGYAAEEVDGIIEGIRKRSVEEGELGSTVDVLGGEREAIEAQLVKKLQGDAGVGSALGGTGLGGAGGLGGGADGGAGGGDGKATSEDSDNLRYQTTKSKTTEKAKQAAAAAVDAAASLISLVTSSSVVSAVATGAPEASTVGGGGRGSNVMLPPLSSPVVASGLSEQKVATAEATTPSATFISDSGGDGEDDTY